MMTAGAELPSIRHPSSDPTRLPNSDPMVPPTESPSLPSEGGFRGHNFAGNGPPLCAGCSKPIMDQFILQVQGHTWHSRCLRCVICHTSLTQTCYAGNNQLYCQQDFYRLFGSQCSVCKATIPPTEVVRRAHDNVYHLNCFRCSVCGKELNTGDEFYLGVEGHLLCQTDYAKAKEEEQDENVNPDKSPMQTREDNRNYNPSNNHQLQALQELHSRHSNPKREEMEMLASRFGMDFAQVRTWFKQKRAKSRRKGDDCNNPSSSLSNNRVTSPPGGYPLPIVNKALSPGCLPIGACRPDLDHHPMDIPGQQQQHHASSSMTSCHQTTSQVMIINKKNFHAWEELWSNEFVPPNVDLEPSHLKNGEVIRLDNTHLPIQSQSITVPHFPPLDRVSLPSQPSSVVQHQPPPNAHPCPCNISSNNNCHGIGDVPWVR